MSRGDFEAHGHVPGYLEGHVHAQGRVRVQAVHLSSKDMRRPLILTSG